MPRTTARPPAVRRVRASRKRRRRRKKASHPRQRAARKVKS